MDRLRKAPYENSYEIGSQARDNTRKRQGEMAPRARRRGGGMRGPGQVKRKKFCVPSQGWWDAGRTPPPPYRSPYASPYRTPPPVLLYGMRSGNGRQGPRCGGRVRLVREEGRDVSSQYGREGVGWGTSSSIAAVPAGAAASSRGAAPAPPLEPFSPAPPAPAPSSSLASPPSASAAAAPGAERVPRVVAAALHTKKWFAPGCVSD
jgi:hypothetical protein